MYKIIKKVNGRFITMTEINIEDNDMVAIEKAKDIISAVKATINGTGLDVDKSPQLWLVVVTNSIEDKNGYIQTSERIVYQEEVIFN